MNARAASRTWEAAFSCVNGKKTDAIRPQHKKSERRQAAGLESFRFVHPTQTD
ncbi:hypothetical protein HMPREF7215_1602 [Pyramidobacter piscolens W5455]|uniref:Uncharacterized protein n=1 Tax=Pyramidobacter piscolens W5455 TaxID=352165 RepID=A0ABM9ZST0_9BACT|nr:hypothetical protein HMPREF7215_1602 [Pyramidobacter piscolens W5455]